MHPLQVNGLAVVSIIPKKNTNLFSPQQQKL
uniref:Uncharacterized protein n=1 Tax=Rhizophora mucronata TaxID=61149 RepID=A0A2P2KY99_RHIMU